MYCPQCAAQLVDSDKFCRACGADLKATALALAQQPLSSKAGRKKNKEPKKEKTWMEKRSQGMRDAVVGATMVGGSLLIGLVINILNGPAGPDSVPGMAVWAVFFGWMACWGVFSLASGLGAIAQAATMGPKAAQPEPPEFDAAPLTVPDTDPLDNAGVKPLLSVAENTTRSLEPAHKEYVAKE
jgi:zinc ribbon protein